MRILPATIILSVLLAASCASDAEKRSEIDMVVVDKKSDRQVQVEFDGACALSMAEGKYSLGDSKYVLQHEGKTYYFASAEAKEKFEKNFDSNLSAAQENWIKRYHST